MASTEQDKRRDRILGCLYGLMVGDAMGAPYEFKIRDSYTATEVMEPTRHFNLPAGYYTDDTSQSLILLKSLLDNNGMDPVDFIIGLLKWLQEGYMSSTGKCFDIGIQTKQMQRLFHQKYPNALQLDFNRSICNPYPELIDETARGNGSLMRIAPVALYCHKNNLNLRTMLEMAQDSSRVTHPSKVCLDACRIYSMMIWQALQCMFKESILNCDYSKYEDTGDLLKFHQDLDGIVEGTYKTKTRDQIQSSGYVIHSLEAALWALWTTDNFKDGVMLLVNLGSDADTIASIYGQLAGAIYGFDQIPAEWLQKLPHQHCNKLLFDQLL